MLKIKKLVFGTLLSVLLSAALLSVFSLIVLKLGKLPGGAAGTMAAAAGGAAVFLSALLTARWAGERGLWHGLALSGVYCAVYISAALALSSAVGPAPLGVRAFIFLLCGALGGVLGVGQKTKVRF